MKMFNNQRNKGIQFKSVYFFFTLQFLLLCFIDPALSQGHNRREKTENAFISILDSSREGRIQKFVKPKRADNIKKYGFSFEELTEDTIKQLCGKLFDKYKDDIGLDRSEVFPVSIVKENDGWQVQYQQQIESIPVYQTSVRFTIRNNGMISPFRVEYFHDIHSGTIPKITAGQAIEIAKKNSTVQGGEFSKPTLIILKKKEATFLTWMVNPHIQNASGIFVDAISGAVVRVEHIIE